MTSLLINKGHFKTPLEIPRSKSFANRALILSALSKKSKTVQFLPSSTDVTFLINALVAVGVKIDRHGEKTTFKNSFPECETSQVEPIHIGEGGTTARFLACLLMKGSLRYELILGERLKERPWKSFIKLMNDLGGKVSLVGNKLILQGPVSLPPHLEVDCSHTTQFASGLQMAFPQSQVLPYLMKTSQSYWDLTIDTIKEVSSLDTVTVPMDWSSASYLMAFAAINQEIELKGLRYDPLQADAKFLTLLRKFGAIKKENEHGITVGLATTKEPITLDVQDCLDLVPALSFFLAHIPGEHILVDLVHKESDRLSKVWQLLAHFNRNSELVGTTLKIFGSDVKINQKVTLKMPDDHRMVMAGTLFLLHHGGGEISPIAAVNKSFPGFFSLLAEISS